MAAVKKDGKYGFIDKAGKVVARLQYDDVGSFRDGLAWVQKNDKRGYIDTTGKALTERISLHDFRKRLSQGDDIYYDNNNDFGKGMILEIKDNLVQIQTNERLCTQKDHQGSCVNYIDNTTSKWVKRSDIYPTDYLDW